MLYRKHLLYYHFFQNEEEIQKTQNTNRRTSRDDNDDKDDNFNINVSSNNNGSSFRGQTYSEIPLKNEAVKQHEIKKQLVNKKEGRMFHFENENALYSGI